MTIMFVFLWVCLIIGTCEGNDEPSLKLADECSIPLVKIAPGKFTMGRTSQGAALAAVLSLGDQGDWATEGPVREVTITKPFLIGKYKVTTKQFCRFLNSVAEPRRFVGMHRFASIEIREGKYAPQLGREEHPVSAVHWDGAHAFCLWASHKSGRKVRLPTEAEWEFVARGSEGRLAPWGGRAIQAWASSEGQPVSAFPENVTPQGVVGMVDVRVGEWCSDFYGVRYLPNDTTDPMGPTKVQLPVSSDLPWLATLPGEYHVLRGRVRQADWSTTARSYGLHADQSGIYGFRVVMEPELQ